MFFLDALSVVKATARVGFDIGTLPAGFSVASDGVAKRSDPDGTPPWDTDNMKASAGYESTTFYFSLKQGATSGDAAYFDVTAEVVALHDEAHCTPTLSTNRSYVSQNISGLARHSVELTVTYNCDSAGMSRIKMHVTPDGGYDPMELEWHRTTGSALVMFMVDDPANPKSVVSGGSALPGWIHGGGYLANAYELKTSFTLALANHSLPLSGSQPLLPNAISLDFIPNIVAGGAPTGTALAAPGGKLSEGETLTLDIVYNCKGFGYVNITMVISMPPFLTTTLRWSKYCEHVEGFTVEQTAPTTVNVVKDGIAQMSWTPGVNGTIEKKPGESVTTFLVTSTQISLPMIVQPLIVGGDTTVCQPKLAVSVPACASKAGCIVAPSTGGVKLTVTYNCDSATGGELSLTLGLDLHPARNVVFGWSKYWAKDPSINVVWTSKGGTVSALPIPIVTDGNIAADWQAIASLPATAPHGYSLNMTDSSHLRFVLDAASTVGVTVTAVDSTNKDCDPLVRGPFTGRNVVKNGGSSLPIDVTLWCKQDGNGGKQSFSATVHSGAYNDIVFYFTVKVNFISGFQIFPCSGQDDAAARQCNLANVQSTVPAWDSGAAQGNWVQSPQNPIVILADTGSDQFFIRTSSANVRIGEPRLFLNDTTLCKPVVTLDPPGATVVTATTPVVLTVSYNCTEVTGTTDIVMILPIEGYSDALIRWHKHSFPALPSAPRRPDGEASWDHVDLTITAPNGNGALIDGFVIHSIGDKGESNRVNVTLASPIAQGKKATVTVHGLKEGVQYSFTAAAVNIAGAGPASSQLELATVKRNPFVRAFANPIGRVLIIGGGIVLALLCVAGAVAAIFFACGGADLICKKKKGKRASTLKREKAHHLAQRSADLDALGEALLRPDGEPPFQFDETAAMDARASLKLLEGGLLEGLQDGFALQSGGGGDSVDVDAAQEDWGDIHSGEPSLDVTDDELSVGGHSATPTHDRAATSSMDMANDWGVED